MTVLSLLSVERGWILLDGQPNSLFIEDGKVGSVARFLSDKRTGLIRIALSNNAKDFVGESFRTKSHPAITFCRTFQSLLHLSDLQWFYRENLHHN